VFLATKQPNLNKSYNISVIGNLRVIVGTFISAINIRTTRTYVSANIISRAVTVFETETVVFSKTDGNRNHGLLVPDKRPFESGQQARFTDSCGLTRIDVITVTREHVYQHQIFIYVLK